MDIVEGAALVLIASAFAVVCQNFRLIAKLVFALLFSRQAYWNPVNSL